MFRALTRSRRDDVRASARYALSDSVVSSDNDSGIVLFELTSGRIFTANRTGALIWYALGRRQAPEAIAADLSREHRIPLEATSSCTTRFVSHLVANGLVRAEGNE